MYDFINSVKLSTKFSICREYWKRDCSVYVIEFAPEREVIGARVFTLTAAYNTRTDILHFEKQYEDIESVTFCNVDDSDLLSDSFKRNVRNYIISRVKGISPLTHTLSERNISVNLSLAIPKGITIGQFQKWLRELSVEVNRIESTDSSELGIVILSSEVSAPFSNK